MAAPEPSLFAALATQGWTWPCVSDHCHVIVQVNPMRSFQLPPSKRHQRFASMVHSRDGGLFIMGIVDSSSNIAFVVMIRKFRFGLIAPNDFVPGALKLV